MTEEEKKEFERMQAEVKRLRCDADFYKQQYGIVKDLLKKISNETYELLRTL